MGSAEATSSLYVHRQIYSGARNQLGGIARRHDVSDEEGHTFLVALRGDLVIHQYGPLPQCAIRLLRLYRNHSANRPGSSEPWSSG